MNEADFSMYDGGREVAGVIPPACEIGGRGYSICISEPCHTILIKQPGPGKLSGIKTSDQGKTARKEKSSRKTEGIAPSAFQSFEACIEADNQASALVAQKQAYSCETEQEPTHSRMASAANAPKVTYKQPLNISRDWSTWKCRRCCIYARA